VTKVDFYVLDKSANGDRYQLACRIAEKAHGAGHRVLIHTLSDDEAVHLDRLLWTFNDQSFLPHGLLNKVDHALNPILIGDGALDQEEHDVLINLAMDVPTFFSRFKRLAECVDNDNTARTASRDRFKFYRDRGYLLNTHNIA